MCSAHHLMVLYICVKFHENITHGRNGYVQCSKGNNSTSRQTRVTVHVFCILSHDALHWCHVLRKYLSRYQSYGADMKLQSSDRWMDIQMDGRTDGWTDRHSKLRTV